MLSSAVKLRVIGAVSVLLVASCGPGEVGETAPPTSTSAAPTTSTSTTPPTTTTSPPTTPAVPTTSLVPIPAGVPLPAPQTDIQVFSFDDMVWDVAATRSGSVLLGTETGLVEWDPESGRVARLTTLDGLPFNDIRQVGLASDGIWASAGWRDVAFYDGTDWTVFDESDGLSGEHPLALAVGPDDVVWVGDHVSGLSRFDGNSWSEMSGPWEEILDLEFGPDGTLWVGSWRGLWSVFPDGDFERAYMGAAVYDVDVAPNGDVWYDTWSPALQHHGIRWLQGHLDRVPRGWSMADPAVAPDGTVWAVVRGTPEGESGVAQWEGESSWSLIQAPGGPDGRMITALEALPDGSLLAGTTSTAFRFDSQWTAIDGGTPPSISANWIEADGAKLWAGSESLAWLENGVWSTTPYPAPLDEESGAVGIVDGLGGVWVGTARGLAHFDGTDWTESLVDHAGDLWTDYRQEGSEIGPVFDWQLVVGADGALWFTPGGGSGLWRQEGERLDYFDDLGGPVRDVAVAGDGTLYVLTDIGVVVRQGGSWVELPELPESDWVAGLEAGRSHAILVTAEDIYMSAGESWEGLGLAGAWQVFSPPDGTLWAHAGEIMRWFGGGWRTTNVGNLPVAPNLAGVAQTADGTTWVAAGGFLYGYPPDWEWPEE